MRRIQNKANKHEWESPGVKMKTERVLTHWFCGSVTLLPIDLGNELQHVVSTQQFIPITPLSLSLLCCVSSTRAVVQKSNSQGFPRATETTSFWPWCSLLCSLFIVFSSSLLWCFPLFLKCAWGTAKSCWGVQPCQLAVPLESAIFSITVLASPLKAAQQPPPAPWHKLKTDVY